VSGFRMVRKADKFESRQKSNSKAEPCPAFEGVLYLFSIFFSQGGGQSFDLSMNSSSVPDKVTLFEKSLPYKT
jgi:hypothetical protein